MGWHVLRAAGSANTINLPNNTAFEMSYKLVVRNTPTGNAVIFTLDNALATRGTSASTTVVSGDWTVGPNPGSESYSVTLAADTTDGGVAISITAPGSGYHAVAPCPTTEVQ